MVNIQPYTKPDGVLGLPSRAVLAFPKEGPRDFAKYTAAQTGEKESFRAILHELCKTIPDPEQIQVMGRPRHPLSDLLYAVVYKTYVGLSSRRFMTDVRDVQRMGLIGKSPCAAAVTRYMQEESLTPLLRSMIEGVAASFAHIETTFAADASGFRIPQISEWYDAKYRKTRRRTEWLKLHVIVGTKTHIIASAEVTRRYVMDHSQLIPLVDAAARQFQITDVAADSAYSIIKNVSHLDEGGMYPAIPFRKGTNPFIHVETSAWFRMYHIFAANGLEWREKVNRQNQAESTFSMMKRKFGEKVFSKSERAQINEVLIKVLCHNLCVVLYWLHQFGIEKSPSEVSA